MALPALNPPPGRVIEAELLHRFASFVNFDPFLSLAEFFLVLSVGRCKFRLMLTTIGCLLHSVLVGSSQAFRVLQLGDQVFCFSVCSKPVGFHVYQLKSLSAPSSKSSSIFGMVVAPITSQSTVTGFLNRLLNGSMWSSAMLILFNVRYVFLALMWSPSLVIAGDLIQLLVIKSGLQFFHALTLASRLIQF